MHRIGAKASRAWFTCLALVGMVAGHQASFMVAERDGAHRHALLEATGHGSWASVYAVAAALGLAVLVGFIGSSIKSAQAGRGQSGYRSALWRLAPVQIAAFLGVEIVERFSSGASVAEVLSDRIIVSGLFVQLLVAAIACLILLLVSRVIKSLVGLPRTPGATDVPKTFGLRRSFSFSFSFDLSRLPWSLRGPPATSS